jgi:membrane protein required for colicin V production
MIIDLVVGFVILVSAGISFFRGLIREVLTIAGVAAGLFMAVMFGGSLSPIFQSWLGVDPEAATSEKLFDIIPMPLVADICAYASIFVIIVIVVALISHFTSGAVKAMGLGPVDRTLGVIFGIIRAVLLLSLLYLPFHKLMSDEGKEEYFGDSKTYVYIAKTAEFIAQFLPESADVESKVKDEAEKSLKEQLYKNDFLKNDETKSSDKKPVKKQETGYDAQERERLETLFERPSTIE